MARFAVAGAVVPRLTEAVRLAERVRAAVMRCSADTGRRGVAAVFSGKHQDGRRLDEGHRHAHFLCESSAAARAGRITHITIYAPAGFASSDERAFSRLAENGLGRHQGHELKLVLLGVGEPKDFGGVNDRAGQCRPLARSERWISRTPLVPARHVKPRRGRAPEEQQAALAEALAELVRRELSQRRWLAGHLDGLRVEPLLLPRECGTLIGGKLTHWLEFRRRRVKGGGRQASEQGYGFRLTFSAPVRGPIALGYGCHYGLGLFEPEGPASTETDL